jgi:CubicO group peptidase (beta-lactamase class C family)
MRYGQKGNASILRRFRKVWMAPRSKGRWTRLSPSLIRPIPAIHVRWWSSIKAASAYSNYSSDITQMLFAQGDMAGFAASKPLIHPPGIVWHYSGGTSLILSRLLRNSFQSERDYLRFPRERLFEPLAMRSAVLEADDSGTLVAASFMYATARDWARLGLLFLQDGVWQGRRLLPEGWVAYTLTPVSAAPDARYGAHMWLKIPEARDLGEPSMPEASYYMVGYDQQVVAAIPSRDLVLVRLSLSHDKDLSELAQNLAAIVDAFPAKRSE